MKVVCIKSICSQFFCNLFCGFSGQAVDYSGIIGVGGKIGNDLVYCILTLWTNGIVQVFPVKTPSINRRIFQTELQDDVIAYLGNRCSCKSDHRNTWESLMNRPQFPVFRPEVMTPRRDAVCLVNSDE